MLNLTQEDITIYKQLRNRNIGITVFPRSSRHCKLEYVVTNRRLPDVYNENVAVVVRSASDSINVIGLPTDDIYQPIIVSSDVGLYIQKNPQLYPGAVFSPDYQNGVIRNRNGSIIGCTNLIMFKPAYDVDECDFAQ